MFPTNQTVRPLPDARAQPEPVLNSWQLEEMLGSATSLTACARVAKAFARNPAELSTHMLLSTPKEVPFVTLCEHLTRELHAANVARPSVWNALLEAIATQDDGRRVTEQAKHQLLQGCAQSMASLGVSSTYVWSTLISCVPADVQAEERLQATTDIAGASTKVGIEQEVLWKDVVALITDVPASAHAHLRGPAVVAVLDALSFASQDIVSG